MLNYANSEKSRGVVVFAFNTATVDYVGIADRTSRLIDKNLQLPVTLITDDSTGTPEFAYDNIIRVDQSGSTFRTNTEHKSIEWKNFDRYLAYELSPYDETILVDTDYLVLDDSLLKLFETEFDYKLMHHNVSDVGPYIEYMGNTSLPFIWATVVLFKKTERARMFFNLVGRVQRNYPYYRLLYNIREGNYRNDYAFAIANIIINGYSINDSQGIPWTMYSVENRISYIRLVNNSVRIYYANDKATVVPFQNIHVMDKVYLQSEDFDRLVKDICESA